MVIVGISVMTMLRFLMALPAELVAQTEKLDVPAVVGVPVIVPLAVFKFSPVGRLPLNIAHVIGVVPVAVRV